MNKDDKANAPALDVGAVNAGAVGELAIITDRKAVRNWQTNFALHVGALMRKHGLSKSAAQVQAYAQGVEGLSRLLK